MYNKEYQHGMMEEACFLVNYRSKKSKKSKKKRSVRSPIIIIRVPNIRKKRRRRKRSHLRPLLIPIVNIRSLAKADINPAKMIRTNVKMPEMKILAKKAPKLENH